MKTCVVSAGTEVFGSLKSRYKRSSCIMAYWNGREGRINSDTETCSLTPGLVQYYIRHNLIVEGKSTVHLLAKVNWLLPVMPNIRHYYGDPISTWSKCLFDVDGPSSFIPVQRIRCKFVLAEGQVRNKKVSVVCPINSGLNI